MRCFGHAADIGLTSLNCELISNVWYQEIQRSFRDGRGGSKLNGWQIRDRQL